MFSRIFGAYRVIEFDIKLLLSVHQHKTICVDLRSKKSNSRSSCRVLILCAGDKSTPDQDILKAKEYWAEYEERDSANQ
jgi:hypothetical protein